MERQEMLKRFYDRYAEYYWEVNDKRAVKRESYCYDKVFAEYLPADRNGRALDCGSGGGLFMYFLKRHGFVKAVGVDLCADLVEFQKHRLEVSAVLGDAIAYLRDAKPGFELIAATDFVEHLPKEQAVEFLCLAADKLSPTGRFFVKVPNMCNLFAARSRYSDFTHELGFTEHSLATALKACGFAFVHIISDYPFDKEPEAMKTVREMYEVFGGMPAPRVLSKNIVAICGHEPVVPANPAGGAA